jgi:hypothetical protein
MVLSNMNRLGVLTGGGLVALATAIPVLHAQTPAPRQAAPALLDRNEPGITVTGCLLLGPYGDFTISKTLAVPGSIMNSVAWKLEGSKTLLAHVLEKVEVTGVMLPAPLEPLKATVTGDGNRPADHGGAASYRLRVKTIKKLAGDCS